LHYEYFLNPGMNFGGQFQRRYCVMGKAVNVLPVMLVIFLFLSAGTALAAVQPPPEGGVLPDMEFSVPKNPEHREYLGLNGKDTFRIPEIKADVVIVEIFSMY
jgi:hypothetical protein